MTTPEGWYEDGQGQVRKWDGNAWTQEVQELPQRKENRIAKAAQRVVTNTWAAEDGVIWSAVGKPITGIGAGRYKLTDETLYFERGTLSLKAEQIHTHEIQDVDASQTMTQKARGVGTIVLSVQRPTGPERVTLDDIGDFRQGIAVINRVSLEARERWRLRQQTQNVNYSGGLPVSHVQTAPATASAPTSDLNAELSKLADFHDKGILTDDEFSAAKKKLLGL